MISLLFYSCKARVIDRDSLFLLISRSPQYARNLRNIFFEFPHLIPIYETYDFSSVLPAGAEDKPFGDTRLSSSDQETVIRERINRNREYVRNLAEKIRKYLEKLKGQQENITPNSPVIISNIHGMAQVELQYMGHPEFPNATQDGVYVHIEPMTAKHKFYGHDFRMRATGMVDSAFHARQYEDIGYVLREAPFSEAELIEILSKYDLDDPLLIEKLEESTALLDYITTPMK